MKYALTASLHTEILLAPIRLFNSISVLFTCALSMTPWSVY